ncbi:hypothetical protein PHMEG_00030330, partial [Phytophthora megakarya]
FDSERLKDMAQNGWNFLPENTTTAVVDDPIVDKMYDGYCGPSEDIQAVTMSPLSLFTYFLPRSFWRHVASESNRYWKQTLESRLNKMVERENAVMTRPRRSKDALRRKLEKFQRILPHEILQWIGLMLAHALNPRKRFESHWCVAEDGVIPAGTFGKVMSRDRFRDITRYLHFSDNEVPEATKDRAWKIRPILATLERTFNAGYVLGPRVAIDEGMLPSRNRMNPTRQYMKDKPHKWGSKCVMTCCAETGYCKR